MEILNTMNGLMRSAVGRLVAKLNLMLLFINKEEMINMLWLDVLLITAIIYIWIGLEDTM